MPHVGNLRFGNKNCTAVFADSPNRGFNVLNLEVHVDARRGDVLGLGKNRASGFRAGIDKRVTGDRGIIERPIEHRPIKLAASFQVIRHEFKVAQRAGHDQLIGGIYGLDWPSR